MADQKKIVFFERIRFLHLPAVFFYLWRGYSVFVFDFDFSLKQLPWLWRLINQGKIKRIYILPSSVCHGEAIDQTEILYRRLPPIRLRRNLEWLFGDSEVDVIFKKSFVHGVFQCFYMNDFLSNRKYDAGESCVFIPIHYYVAASLVKRYGDFQLKQLEGFCVPQWSRVAGWLIRIYDRLILVVGGFFFLTAKIFLMVIGKIFCRISQKDSRFTYVVALHQLFEIKFQNKRGFNFLLDGKTLSRENTLFFFDVVVDKKWVQSREKEGYFLFQNRGWQGLGMLFQSNCSWKTLGKMIASVLKLFAGIGYNFYFLNAYVRGVNTFVSYRSLINHFRFRHYIYMNQETPAQAAANIMVRSSGGQTWNYAFSIGGGLLYAREQSEFSQHRHILWSFLNNDHYVAISVQHIDYFKLHHQRIRNYHLTGSLYSSMIRDIISEGNRESILRDYFGTRWQAEQKVISFFDTTFIYYEDSFTSFDDAKFFYGDILRLINAMPDLVAIIKPSKSEDFFISPRHQWSFPEKGKDVIQLWDQLKNHERVCWAGHTGDLPTIMAVSDVVVTHCFSSPSTEALGARKKAFWYESGQRHRGLLYDNIPGLVAHGYDELQKKINELLYRIPDQEYAAYLDTNIKGKIEPFLDGLALTRFRELLTR